MAKIPTYKQSELPSSATENILIDPSSAIAAQGAVADAWGSFADAARKTTMQVLEFRNKRDEIDKQHTLKQTDLMLREGFDRIHRSQALNNSDDRVMEGEFSIQAEELKKNVLSNKKLDDDTREQISLMYDSRFITEVAYMRGIMDRKSVSRLQAQNDLIFEQEARDGLIDSARQTVEDGYAAGLYSPQDKVNRLNRADFLAVRQMVEDSQGNPDVMATVKQDARFEYLTKDDYDRLDSYSQKLHSAKIERLNTDVENAVLEQLRTGQFNAEKTIADLDLALYEGADPKLITSLKAKVTDGDIARTSLYAQSFLRDVEVRVALGDLSKANARKLIRNSDVLSQATAPDIEEAVSMLNKWDTSTANLGKSEKIVRYGMQKAEELNKAGLFGNRVFEERGDSLVDVTQDMRQKELSEKLEAARKQPWFSKKSEEKIAELEASIREEALRQWDEDDKLYIGLQEAIKDWGSEEGITEDEMERRIRKFIAIPATKKAAKKAVQRHYDRLNGSQIPQIPQKKQDTSPAIKESTQFEDDESGMLIDMNILEPKTDDYVSE